MLLISCPWCGPRDEIEFHCGGEAHIVRPDPETASDAVWADYLFMRTNPKGPMAERWLHSHGCRRWFNAVRDTTTHQFLAVYRMGEPPPAGLLDRVAQPQGAEAVLQEVVVEPLAPESALPGEKQ
ncbi:sarcosine oxidase subunit delta [Zavarzinia sp. CC-PAN008]|uniref:sarcosine oxidase subunit delta n=1 Tax=Zavarzinia sp. CC-PAN008 TaxID=3243332 RepID=UPI003F74926D